ncbi:MAG: sigma-54-dependent Fis family transcriptional regulator [Planctomycetes bacterium]|nr:sigma-54-dependent Fis family transcriptional regulator [Planctomycetota bacterium]
MSSLRRIVVVSKAPQIHRLAQELGQEVFGADDLREAAEILSVVRPDLIVFDGTFAPAQIRAHLEQISFNPGPSGVAVALLDDTGPFSERDYEQAGLPVCLRGEANLGRLREFVAGLSAAPRQRPDLSGDDTPYFLDEAAAAVALAGRSPALQKTLHMIKLVAASQCNPVLVMGDTGTGKEIAARAVHHLRHPQQPFVAINCAALTATLLESELFGHVKGAFTGAERDKTGLLEWAGAGTLFLDEVSEMPLELQAKLLRLLQEKTFRKVGGVRDLECRATLIASSNRDLKKEVREKRFRQDLYYRLNICPIALAPLRAADRRQDIPLLARYFLGTSGICTAKQNRITAITPLALEVLSRHPWPGNVRELRNVIERAILLETTDKIGLGSILLDPLDEDRAAPIVERGTVARLVTADGCGAREVGRPTSDVTSFATATGARSVQDFSLEKAERELIARALHETGWQKTQAAALLGITRATLYAKVKQYDIRKRGQAGEEPTPGTVEDPAIAALVS